MEMKGEYRIPAPRQRVWEGLNDPEILKASIPGCETVEKVSDTEFTAKVVAKVGPVKARFGGKVTLSDLDPPNGYTITGEGTGGVAGFAKGSAKVSLSDQEGGTLLGYEVQAHVGGKLAQIGSRLIDATSRKMADEFFSRFVAAVSPQAEGAAAANGGGTAQSQARAALDAAPRQEPPVGEPSVGEPVRPGRGGAAADFRLPPAVWVSGLTLIVAAILWLFTAHGAMR